MSAVLGLPVRAAVLLASSFLAACEYAYGVQRRTEAPAGFEFSRLEDVVMTAPGYAAAESRIERDYCLVRDGDAHAAVSFDGRSVWVGSIWISCRPSTAVLEQSIKLQQSLIQRMRSAVPSLPSEEAWATEWVGMEAQQATGAGERNVEGEEAQRQRKTKGE